MGNNPGGLDMPNVVKLGADETIAREDGATCREVEIGFSKSR